MKRLIKSLFLFSLISLSLSQTIFSHNYNKTPQAKLDVNICPNNSRKTNLSCGCSIKSIRQILTYSELFSTPTECFQEAFQNEKPAIIFESYWLYEFPEFREYIKTLHDYKEHIQGIHKK